MNHALNASLPFLDAGQMLTLASSVDSTHARTIKAVERLNKDVETRKREIANRWKDAPLESRDRRRIEAEEIRVAILNIRQNAERELDALLKEAGAAHAKVIAQRPFYDSPVKTLNRLTLGDPKRSEYQRQLQGVGTAELAHLGQFAVSSRNLALAAAIVSRLDHMPSASRPFNAASIATAMQVEEHRKASEAIKLVEARFQGVVVAIRAWKAGKANPLNSVSLALQTRTLDERLLAELERDDAAA